MRKHPIQNVHVDEHGMPRFVQNKIVRWLVDNIPGGLNTIASKEFQPEDYEQLMQLIGYSLRGFEELCMNEENPCQFRTLASAERKKKIVLS